VIAIFIPRCSSILFLRSSPILFLIYRLACLDPITQRAFFLTAYSGRWSESFVIAECLKQYGFHFLTLSKYSSFCFFCSSMIDPFSTNRLIYFGNRFKTFQIASDLIGAPVRRLQINLALGLTIEAICHDRDIRLSVHIPPAMKCSVTCGQTNISAGR
jgi:hypothetical protein